MITKLKDFILDEIPTKEECEAKKRNKTEYCFTLEYENDSDFILKKTSPRSEKLLVVLVSQGQIYIKDNKANTIEKVEDIQQIRNFKKGLHNEIPFVKLSWSPFYSVDLEDFKLLLSDVDTCKELMNRKLNPFDDHRLFREYRRDKASFADKFERVKALQLLKPDARFSDIDNVLNNMRLANITYNQIKDNLDLLNEFSYDSFEYFMSHHNAHRVFDTYKCDFKALFTWLLYTMKYRNRMCFESTYWGLSFNVGDYIHYLEMQYQMYGKCKEKYPENWLTEKHIMNQKHKDWKRLQTNNVFKLHQEHLRDKVSYENDFFKVVTPITNADILDEAEQQRHCVASYIDRIIKGETNIVFIREKSNLDASLLTVEIRDNKICQVRGFQNRAYNKIEYDFMKEWAEKKGLELVVPDVEV